MANSLSSLFSAIQTALFPVIEQYSGTTLTTIEQRFIRVVELCALEKHLVSYSGSVVGRPRSLRLSIASAFIAKAVYNFPTTKLLVENLRGNSTLRYLCGWVSKKDIPSESTFSRAFADFSVSKLPSLIHEAMIKTHYGNKLAGHIARDSTPIDAREKPLKKLADSPKCKFRRGRPKKNESRPPKKPDVLQMQLRRSLKENLSEIPVHCGVGIKLDSKGYKKTWIGYKLHADVIDGDIPVSVIFSSASTHDSQVAIPLAQMSAQRVTNLYDLMDAAYDAAEIKEFSKRIDHVAIIDPNPRSNSKAEMEPAQAIRFHQRTAAERVMSSIKDNYGGRYVRVKGIAKVAAHLMFGVLALTAEQLFRLIE